MRPQQTALLDEAVPRYTSYPTAPHFHAGVDAARLSWLAAGARRASRSRSTCTYRTATGFAGSAPATPSRHGTTQPVATISRAPCRDRHGRRPDRTARRGGRAPFRRRLADDADARRHGGARRPLRSRFAFRPDAEISVEIEPNDMDEARFDALAEIGMTRASLGVQDFDPKVQTAINREQSFEQTARSSTAFVHAASIGQSRPALRPAAPDPRQRRLDGRGRR